MRPKPSGNIILEGLLTIGLATTNPQEGTARSNSYSHECASRTGEPEIPEKAYQQVESQEPAKEPEKDFGPYRMDFEKLFVPTYNLTETVQLFGECEQSSKFQTTFGSDTPLLPQDMPIIAIRDTGNSLVFNIDHGKTLAFELPEDTKVKLAELFGRYKA